MGLVAAWHALFRAPGSNADLADRLEAVETELADVRVEWAAILKKLTKWANRQAAESRRALDALESDDPEAVDTPVPPISPAEMPPFAAKRHLYAQLNAARGRRPA